MTAVMACHGCGTETLENARFCHECGAPLAVVDTHAEYKQVTVLFADVHHSMDIAVAVGAERLREIMTELVERAAAVVQRFGGTVDKFTGDGIMAVFGAPVALEDHAVRACLAALEIQAETSRLAEKVQARDGVALRLRVGLNSGQVIAGEIGSGPLGYTAIGEQVGMAQRMESAAPPAGVMLSASTARLVEGELALGTAEMVRVKGAGELVHAQRLLGIGDGHRVSRRVESNLIGRRWETAALEGLLERAVDGRGAVVAVVGSPGIGKSRLMREAAAMARRRDVEVFSTYCESHAADVPFRAVARLLRATTGVEGLDAPAARARLRAQVRDPDNEDLAYFEDLVGIADPGVVLPKIDPDARRRRLTALVNAALLARQTPAVYIVEDVHWIDEASESMLAEFVSVIPQTPSLALITYRPEYRGALMRAHGAQTIALAPLNDSETAALVAELLGSDAAVDGLAAMIAGRAAGNPFFAEEMVRDLAERGVLRGNRGAYVSTAGAAEVTVPATLQSTIAARIDRLDPAAKRTLSAASVIGSRFSLGLLVTLGVDPTLDDLVTGELIDRITFTGDPEYVFHHPLIRTVAYESQLKSDRAELHRRVAAAIASGDPSATEENAALIAEHLEAAGDGHAAFGWHMRAAAWATNRDIASARLSWERAIRIADALPAEDPNRTAMRIAPRTMLCGTAFRVRRSVPGEIFDQLRELCAEAGDKASLAIAMTGLVLDRAHQGNMPEASQLASEAMLIIESVGEPTLMVGLSPLLIRAKISSAEVGEMLRWSQRIIDLAQGDPSRGNFIVGSPLALGYAQRAVARCTLGRAGWREDLLHGLAMARSADPMSYAMVVTFVYLSGIPNAVLSPHDHVISEIDDALAIAERAGDDLALAFARLTLGFALVHRPTDAEHERGWQLLNEVSEMFRSQGHHLGELPVVDVYLAREMARRGERDEAISLLRNSLDRLAREGQLAAWGLPTTAVLVEELLERAAEGDLAEAEAAVERVAPLSTDPGLAVRHVWRLRLLALLARARDEDGQYVEFRDRYRHTANEHGFERHVEWAEAMP